MKWTNKGHEYDSIKDVILNNHSKILIWGAGACGYAFCEEFKEKVDVVGFIDNDASKQESTMCDKQVFSPSYAKSNFNDDYIVVSTGRTESVYQELEKWGKVRFKDYCHIDEWTSMYHYSMTQKVVVSDLTMPITQRCTLRCEHCNSFIPVVKNPKDEPLDKLIYELDLFFKWVDQVNILGIGGGDAMSNPHFNEILDEIGQRYYPKRAKNIEIYSNAVIVPNEKTLELFRKYNILYRFTDYHGNAGRQRGDEIEKLLGENGIMCDRVNFDVWYDTGYPQQSNGLISEDDLIEFCRKCDRKTCHGIEGNRFFSCMMCNWANRIDYCDVIETDYFDLNQNKNNHEMEFIEYYLGFSEKGYYNYCKKCNGGINNNNHPVMVGVQEKR